MATFFSSAKLTRVRRLQVRKGGLRCTGLCIQHLDESIEWLGQWDPLDASPITTIYDSQDGGLESVSFSFSRVAKWEDHVVDIRVNEPSGGHDVQHFTSEQLTKVWMACT